MSEEMEKLIADRIQERESASARETAQKVADRREQEVYNALNSPKGLDIDSANFLPQEAVRLLKGFVYSMKQASVEPNNLIWESRWEVTGFGIFRSGRQVDTHREGWLLPREAYKTWDTDRDGHTSGPTYTAYRLFCVSPEFRISAPSRTDYKTSVNSNWDLEVIKTSIIDKLISEDVAWHDFPEQSVEN